MGGLGDVLTWIANNIFNQVAILIGLITLVGLMLQRKKLEDVVAGALRATVGVITLFVGIDVFIGGLVAFQTIVGNAAGLQAPTASATLGDFLAGQGGTIALVITVGFFIHLLVVRLVPAARYVYLTGHLMFWISVVAVASLVTAFGDLPQSTLVIAGSIIVAVYWTLQPVLIAPTMRKVIGSDDYGYGHTSALACWLGAKFAPLVGSREKHDSEKLQLPRQLAFFKDVTVSTALVIAVIMLVAMAFADKGLVAEQAAAFNADINPWIWGIVVALRFAAGISILLYGVRMFLAEIVPAFKGVSDRLIPGSRPALDCPTVFSVAPTAVMIGFVSSTVAFLILMGVFAAAGWFVLVPPMIMLFFPGAAAGVFGNQFGGWRGAVLGGAINGILLAFGQWLTWGLLSNTAPELATLADPDWYAIAWLTKWLGLPFSGETGAYALAGISVVLLVVGLLWAARRDRVRVS